MLPKSNRLSRSDFDLIFKKGRRVRGKTFSLIILPSTNRNEPSKIGVIVTKRVCKKAVDRNKLKRQIRNAINSEILKSLPPGQKIIVMAFPAVKPKKHRKIKEELVELFGRNDFANPLLH